MLIGIGWGLPNVESWNGDDISPNKPLRVASDWLRGWHKYPYLHWWLNAVLYAPYVALLAVAGQVDLGCFPRIAPSCFAAPYRDLSVLMLLSRLLSVAMGLGVVVAAERLARALHGDRAAALAAAAICAGSAALVALSHTANLDVPQTFWFAWSMLAAVRVWQRGALADHVAFGALAGCAISTKDAIAGAYVLPGLALAAVHAGRVARERGVRGARLAGAALRDRRFLALALLPVAIYAAVQNAVMNPSGLVDHVRFWVDGSEVLDRYRARPHGPGHLAWRTWLGLEAGLGAPMAALALVALALAPLRQARLAALWLPLLSYLALTVVPNFVEPRILLPMLPLLAVAGGALAASVLRRAGRLRPLAAALLAGVLAHEVGVALNADLHLLRDPRYEAERWLAERVERDAQIAALGGRGFMPRLERLGYAPVWFEPAEIRPRAIEVRSFDYAILTQPYHPASDKAWQEALRNGKTGAQVVFDAAPRTPLDRWFSTRLHPGLVRPRITVVRLH
jgi:4-amino-4-deoxy-L-arabinose transferase-like glycosyltransferase